MVIEREIKSEYLRVNAPTEIQTVNRLYYTDSPIDYMYWTVKMHFGFFFTY